ncbi:MAG: hypothetical protein HYZ29_28335 [Myxococcales bacterium]|nr:hypothetical protein [Myxococcales bacterium]
MTVAPGGRPPARRRSSLDVITELVSGGAGPQALANVLDVTERWRPGDLERAQMGRLAALVEHARATVERSNRVISAFRRSS